MKLPDLVVPLLSCHTEEDKRKLIRHVVANGNGANILFDIGTTAEFDVLPPEKKKAKHCYNHR